MAVAINNWKCSNFNHHFYDYMFGITSLNTLKKYLCLVLLLFFFFSTCNKLNSVSVRGATFLQLLVYYWVIGKNPDLQNRNSYFLQPLCRVIYRQVDGKSILSIFELVLKQLFPVFPYLKNAIVISILFLTVTCIQWSKIYVYSFLFPVQMRGGRRDILVLGLQPPPQSPQQ